MGKDSFVIVRDQRPAFESLSDEDAGRLIKAVLAYQFDGVTPVLPPVPSVAFAMLLPVFERFAAKYAETCRKRKEAGAKGGKAKAANASKSQQDLANASKAKQNVDDRDRDRVYKNKESKISVTTHTEKNLVAGCVCGQEPRSYSQEELEDARQDTRREAEAVRQEFEQLRDAYKAVRDDGPVSGWAEYQQVRFAKGWPGLLFVLDRLQTLIEQDEQWKRGYKEGLRRFLTDRMWEMEPRKAAPPQQQPASQAPVPRGQPQAQGMTFADMRNERNKSAFASALTKIYDKQGEVRNDDGTVDVWTTAVEAE